MNRYGWVMVAIGGLMGCVAVGAMFSLAVYLQPITESTGWSRAGVSGAMTLGFLVMGIAGVFGLGAVAIALAFPPFPRSPARLQPA